LLAGSCAVPVSTLTGTPPEQIPGLPEQRTGRVEHSSLDPGVEIVRSSRGVVAHELSSVGRRAAHDRVDLDGKQRIGDTPEFGGKRVIKRVDDQFQAGPPA